MKNTTKAPRKLDLSRQTVRTLTAQELSLTAGGFSSDTIYNTCRYGGCNGTTAYGGGSGGYSC